MVVEDISPELEDTVASAVRAMIETIKDKIRASKHSTQKEIEVSQGKQAGLLKETLPLRTQLSKLETDWQGLQKEIDQRAASIKKAEENIAAVDRIKIGFKSLMLW